MPVGEQPAIISSTAFQYQNTEGLKVYYKLNPSQSWTVDKSLICTGHGKTKGSKIGSAQFAVLTPNNDEADTDWVSTNLAMRTSAAQKYKVDMSDGYKSPYMVMVTDIISGVEKGVWQGYISTVNQNFVEERCTVSGLNFTGLMDQQQIFGGWYVTTEPSGGLYTNVNYFYDYVPVYNPGGIGNKSSSVKAPDGKYTVEGIDGTLGKSTVFSSGLWTVKDLLFQIFSRCIDPIFDGTQGGGTYDFQWWLWVKDIYATAQPFDVSKVIDLLNKSSTLNDYSLQGKTIWEAIVELTESVDGLTVTEEMDTDSESIQDHRPYVSFVNLKG